MRSAQIVVVGTPAPAVKKGETGYTEWVIVSIHAIREYLGQPYRRLMDILYEMPRLTRILGLRLSTRPDLLTVCARKQQPKMAILRTLHRQTVELHELGDIQAIDATGVDRIAASQHYAKRTNYTYERSKRLSRRKA